MALPQRKSSFESATRTIPAAEESSPWCIDYGNAIDVMRTDEVRYAVTRGFLDTEHKAWRDGRPCWLPISDLPELQKPIEQSGPRRIVRPAPPSSSTDDERLPDFTVPLFTPRSAIVGALAVLTIIGCFAVNAARVSPVRTIGPYLAQALHR